MFFANLDKSKEYVFIGFNELKPFIMHQKALNPRLNSKFYSLSDLEKIAFGETTIEATKVAMPFVGGDFSLAKKFVNYIKKGVDTKIDTRIEQIKNEIVSKDLLFIDPNAKQTFKDNEIYVFGYLNTNIELLHVFETLEINLQNVTFIDMNNVFKQSEIKVYKFARNDEDIKFAFYKILELLRTNDDENIPEKDKIKPSEIKIFTDVNSNYFYLKLYAKELGLELNMDDGQTLYDTKIAKILEKNISTLDANSISTFDDKSQIFQDIKSILEFFDFYNSPNRLLNFKNILKDYPVSKKPTNESIEVRSDFKYLVNKHIFVIGFDDNFYTKVSKNNDYFDDAVKSKFGLNPTTIENVENDILLTYFLRTNNDFHFYYHESDGLKREVSFYLQKRYPGKNKKTHDFNYLDHIFKPEIICKDYSSILAKAYYSYFAELKYKYYLTTENYILYNTYFGDLERYHSDYQKINRPFTIGENYSYSKVNSYYECPFKFFCNNVLKISDFVDSFSTIAGKIIHRTFEEVYKVDISSALDDPIKMNQIKDDAFEVAYQKAYDEFKDRFNSIDKAMMVKLKKAAKHIFFRLVDEKQNSKITKTYAEESIFVENFEGHNYNLYGQIDSILASTNENDETTVQIIDYKTGSTKVEQSKFIYGLGLQLPIYSFLLKQDPRFKDAKISGIYYINVFDSDYNNYYEDDFSSSYKTYLKSGLTSPELEAYLPFEPNLEKDEISQRVASLTCKGGKFNGKHLTDYSLDTIVKCNDGSELHYKSLIHQWFEAFYEMYKNNEFEISPNRAGDDRGSACQFCGFKDICFNDHHLDRNKVALVKFDGYDYDTRSKNPVKRNRRNNYAI